MHKESCRRHPQARAGWKCATCAAALCPECTAVRRVGRIEMEVCATCGNQAEQLRMHRALVQPLGRRILGAVRYPLTRSVGLAMLALAAFQALLSYRSYGPPQAIALLAMVSAGAFWSYFFLIMSSTASGAKELGVPDFRDIREDLVMPAWRGLAAGALVWGPALIYLLVTRGFSLELLDALASPDDPVLWVIAALGAVYVPVALMAGATECGILDVINPVRNAVCIYRLGRDYWLAVGALALLFGGHVLVQLTIVRLLYALPIPYICRVLAIGAGLYFPFVMSRVLGSLLYLRGDALDWGEARDYYEPALPGVAPRAPAPAASPAHAEGPVTTASDRLARTAPAEADALPASSASPAASAPIPAPAAPADPETLFRAGLLSVKARDFAQATRALKTAAFSGHPIAPKAMVALAQVYSDGLGDPESAARLYREAIRRFPDTEVARFAHGKLQAG
jgi:hypothetical protein